MERLSIDEVIAHCNRNVKTKEKYASRDSFENMDMDSNFAKEYWEHRQVAEWLEQLKSYKDAEEQGLLLRLPVPLGTTVYSIDWQIWIDEKGCRDCVYYAVDGFCDYEEEHPACMKVFETKFEFNMRNDFGKTVFITREEAEKALEDMKGKV